jgi:hypothetical protein
MKFSGRSKNPKAVVVPKPSRHMLPVVAHGAEYLVQGHLMRRNILTYKAPPNNEGYDLICIHPDPRHETKQMRIQVKSRYATDCNYAVQVKEKTLGAFDFLVAVFLNIGNFHTKGAKGCLAGRCEPTFYTLPVAFVKKHHDRTSSWEKLKLRNLDIEKFKNDKGFELIAEALSVDYPSRP